MRERQVHNKRVTALDVSTLAVKIRKFGILAVGLADDRWGTAFSAVNLHDAHNLHPEITEIIMIIAK